MDLPSIVLCFLVLFSSFGRLLSYARLLNTCCDDCPPRCLRCTEGRCEECDLGFEGTDCSLSCSPGMYGQDCSRQCQCPGSNYRKRCEYITGACRCKRGWAGSSCDRREEVSSTRRTTTVSEFARLTSTSNSMGAFPPETTSLVKVSSVGRPNTKDSDQPEKNNNDLDEKTHIEEEKHSPTTIIIAASIGVLVTVATLCVCAVCITRRYWRRNKKKKSSSGTESSQRDLIATSTTQKGSSEYSYIDIPDPRTISHQPEDKLQGERARLHNTAVEQSSGRKHAANGKTYNPALTKKKSGVYDELQNHKANIIDSHENYSHVSRGDNPDNYDSFDDIKKMDRNRHNNGEEYWHLETVRGDNPENTTYNSLEKLSEKRPRDIASSDSKYSHVNSLTGGKLGSYSYVDVQPNTGRSATDVAGEYHHVKLPHT